MNPPLVDTHCHVHFAAYQNDADEVASRARAANITMITIGTQSTTSANAVAFARTHAGVYAAVGLHPNHLHRMPIDEDELPAFHTRAETFDMDFYRALAADEKVVGIGETGFDYYRLPEGVPLEEVKAKQEATFRQHLDLCTEIGKPVIVHCRDAHADVLRIFEEYLAAGKLARRGVLHCFTGTIEEAAAYTKLGFYISLSGISTFPAKKNQTENSLHAVARIVPPDQLLIETDSPYLTPPPHRGERNEPLYVQFVAQHLAAALGVSYEDFAARTTANAKRLFSIS